VPTAKSIGTTADRLPQSSLRAGRHRTWLKAAQLDRRTRWGGLDCRLVRVLSVDPVLPRLNSFAHKAIVAARASGARGNWLAAKFAERSVSQSTELRSSRQALRLTFYCQGGDPRSAFPAAWAVPSA
jgi:hypothetical protein